MYHNRFARVAAVLLCAWMLSGCTAEQKTATEVAESSTESTTESLAESTAENTEDSSTEASAESTTEVSAESTAGTSSEAAVYPAIDFTLSDQYGNTHTLSDYKGRVVFLNFWATWCPPCRNELGSFNQMYEKYGEEVQFMMVDLTDGDRETIQGVKDFIVENAYSFPVFYDTKGSGMMAYGITAVPQTFFITADGKIYGQYFGSVTEEQIESALQELTGK